MATQKQNKQLDNQWEDRTVDADETSTVNEEFPGPFEGVFVGTKPITTKTGDTCLHIIRIQKDGMDYKLGLWGAYSINKGFSTVVPGTAVRVSYVGEKDVGRAMPMKLVKVLVPKGAPVREQTFENREGPPPVDSDNVPF